MKSSHVIIFMLVLCFIVTSSLSAQGLTAKGIKGGLNLANFSGSDADIGDISPSMVTKFAVGGFLNFEVNKQFSIRPEVYYSSKGAKYEAGGDELTITTNYIDIPVLAVYNASEQFGLFAGPQVGFYLNGEMATDDGSEDIESEDVTSPYFALAFGANVHFNQFHLDARYVLGLSEVPDVDEENTDVKHSVIQILLGISF